MSLFKPIRLKGKTSIAVCGRCNSKVYYDDLRKDPNTQNWYCPECIDVLDPYRLAPRQVEDISLRHPRIDDTLVDSELCILGADGYQMGLGDDFGNGVGISCDNIESP